MRRWNLIGLLVSAGLFGAVASCQPDSSSGGGDPTKPDVPKPVEYKTTPYVWQKPANFPDPLYNFVKNPMTVEGVELGRLLFYDDALSANGTISCGFCHQQGSAFAHTDHALSHGINDKIGTRNNLSLQNLAFYRQFFWDGGVSDLDLVPIAPIENPAEMGHNMNALLGSLSKSAKYPVLFKKAYGTNEITTERFLKSLSQFMLTMVSANSRYDRYVRKEAGGELIPDELAGLTLFKQKCATCHAGELFTDQAFRNNGLSRVANKDEGRLLITAQPEDKFLFKVPSLRNVDRSPPYMHDGRFQTLEQVLNHYASGVQDVPELDPALRANGKIGVALTDTEKKQIIAFLHTLTDFDYINDRRLGPK